MLAMWAIRFMVFRLLESPRYLVARGNNTKAVEVLKKMAAINGQQCSLTVEQLELAGCADGKDLRIDGQRRLTAIETGIRSASITWKHVKGLFSSRKLALSTSLLIGVWGASCFTHHIFSL